MNRLYDLLLDKPLPDTWLRGLLFFAFYLHFVFVLLVIGTAILAVSYFLRSRWGERRMFDGWDKELLHSFFAHKSLAVVFGVGPILLMQVGNTVPFMTAGSLLAPLWMGLTVFLLVAFALLEYLAERGDTTRWRHLTAAVLGLGFLLAVPATFVAVLVTAENPQRWGSVLAGGGMRLPPGLSAHWLARYLHVIGASLVFSSAFYLIRFRDDVDKRRSLLNWLVGTLLLQGIGGVALYASLPAPPQPMILGLILVGALAAAGLGWWAFRVQGGDQVIRPATLMVLLLLVITPMLLVRQALQDRVMIPFNRQVSANAAEYLQRLRPNRAAALAQFHAGQAASLTDGAALYTRSCQFCHGAMGDGKGEDAGLLAVPPADLRALRVRPEELHRILTQGVPGTSMPPFKFYTRDQLQSLSDFLAKQIGVRREPEPVPVQVSDEQLRQARTVFAANCAACHGPDGGGSELSSHFRPSPPDLRRLTLAPQHAFTIITNGYPGTRMPSYAQLPAPVRWGLVRIIREFYGTAGM